MDRKDIVDLRRERRERLGDLVELYSVTSNRREVVGMEVYFIQDGGIYRIMTCNRNKDGEWEEFLGYQSPNSRHGFMEGCVANAIGSGVIDLGVDLHSGSGWLEKFKVKELPERGNSLRE